MIIPGGFENGAATDRINIFPFINLSSVHIDDTRADESNQPSVTEEAPLQRVKESE